MNKPVLPFVTAALLCEKVLEEKNGTLSVVRIADRLEVETIGIPEEVKPLVNVEGLISIKSGPVVGTFDVAIVGRNPKGESKQLFRQAFEFKGNDQGQNIILRFAMAFMYEGLHWFDVLFDGQLLTTIPLMLVQAQKPTVMK